MELDLKKKNNKYFINYKRLSYFLLHVIVFTFSFLFYEAIQASVVQYQICFRCFISLSAFIINEEIL